MNYQTWQKERLKCEQCKHSRREDDPKQDKPGTIMRCELFLSGRGMNAYCIDARSDERCGVEAVRFEGNTDITGGRRMSCA